MMMQKRVDVNGMNLEHQAPQPPSNPAWTSIFGGGVDELTPGGSKIIMIGDSGCASACKDIERFCGGSTVVNMGVTGSTAAQWKVGDCASQLFLLESMSNRLPPGGPTGCGLYQHCCNATEAFWRASPPLGADFTHAFISLGGNDFMAKTCASSASDLAAIQGDVESVIDNVKAAGPPGMKVVIWGYPVPSQKTREFRSICPGALPGTLQPLLKAIEDAASAKGATFVSGAYATGATSSKWSPNATHADDMHLNSKGYCKFFSGQNIQQALGCQGAPVCTQQQCNNVSIAFGHNLDHTRVCSTVSDATVCSANATNATSPDPTPTPTSAPTSQCRDNDQEFEQAAGSWNIRISTCAEALQKYVDLCTTNTHAEDFKRLCQKSCCPVLGKESCNMCL